MGVEVLAREAVDYFRRLLTERIWKGIKNRTFSVAAGIQKQNKSVLGTADFPRWQGPPCSRFFNIDFILICLLTHVLQRKLVG